jgi:exportin-1
MDPSQLLNTKTPFDESKLALLEQVINVFYTTINNQERQMANKLLDQFQKLDISFQYCEFILNRTQSNNTRVLALNIYESFVKEKWNFLDKDSKLNLRNFLVGLLIKFVMDKEFYANSANHFVINKLNIVIVLIAKNEWTTTWPNFISELCASSKSDANMCDNNMKLLILLSEEINTFWKNSITAKKAYELREKMSKEFVEVFNLCQLVINNSNNVPKNLLIRAIKLFAEYMNWFPINLTLNQDIMMKTLLNFKDLSSCRTETMKCLGNLFGIKMKNLSQNDINNYRHLLIQMYQTFIQIMDTEIVKNKNFADQYKFIQEKSPEKITGYENMTHSFEMSLINFFKSNMSYIQSFDFPEGTQQVNQFLSNYIPQITNGLNYLTQFLFIENEEIFQAAVDFWLWFSYKVFTLKDPNDTLDTFDLIFENNNNDFVLNNNINININNNNNGIHAKYTKDQYLQYLNDSFLYKNCYMKVIDIVRERLCLKMTKPLEVKIDIDENGDIAYDPTKNTIYQTIHENMRETLIYLTYIDPYKTQNLLHAKINEQYDIARQQNKINPSLLNSISWSAGCISGAMNDTIEMQFLIVFIKVLLNLCEIIRGKGNKAICASNIMYVVGQYPKFLNNHWKFLKTVVKKLFEFMHESFEGVQDFACETFLKISIKCARNFTILQQNESEEYIKDLVRNVSETTKDLKPHQQLMFYEAIGNMINSENNISKKTFYIKQLMNEKDMQWNQIFDEAKRNINILNNNNVVKGLSLIILLNERVSFSTKTPYWSYGLNIFENLIKSFIFYSQCINQHFENNKAIDMNIRSYMIYNRTLIKFLTSLVKNTDDVQLIQNDMLPSFGKLIETYNNNHVNNKDPNMLLLFSAILEKIQNKNPEVVATIWKLLSSSTIQLIKNDYESYPEHRMNFFILLKSLISNSFESLFRAQNLSFNKDVIDTITFAINHNTPSMSETGLETLLILLQKVISVKNIDLQNIVDPFFSNYFFILFNDVFNTMTDGFHQSGFKLQVKVIQILIRVIDNKVISENLFDKNEINRNFFLKKLLMDILNSFKNIQQTQGEALCLAMMNNCTDDHKFKSVMRDFLVSLKSFLGNNDILWEEEKKKELEMAQRIEEQKKSFLPGPQYDTQINANNYQDNNMNI